MNRRITFTLNNELESQLREIQANKISEGKKSVSFSDVLNMVLHEGLKQNH